MDIASYNALLENYKVLQESRAEIERERNMQIVKMAKQKVLLDMNAHKIEELKSQISELNATNKECKTKESENLNEKMELTKQLHSLELRYSITKEKTKINATHNESVKSQYKELKRQSEEMKNKEFEFKLQTEIFQIKAEYEMEKLEKQKEYDQLLSELDTIKLKREEMEQIKQKQLTELNVIQSEMETLKKENTEMGSSMVSLQEAYNTKEKKFETLKSDYEKIINEAKETKEKLETMEAELEEVVKQQLQESAMKTNEMNDDGDGDGDGDGDDDDDDDDDTAMTEENAETGLDLSRLSGLFRFGNVDVNDINTSTAIAATNPMNNVAAMNTISTASPYATSAMHHQGFNAFNPQTHSKRINTTAMAMDPTLYQTQSTDHNARGGGGGRHTNAHRHSLADLQSQMAKYDAAFVDSSSVDKTKYSEKEHNSDDGGCKNEDCKPKKRKKKRKKRDKKDTSAGDDTDTDDHSESSEEVPGLEDFRVPSVATAGAMRDQMALLLQSQQKASARIGLRY